MKYKLVLLIIILISSFGDSLKAEGIDTLIVKKGYHIHVDFGLNTFVSFKILGGGVGLSLVNHDRPFALSVRRNVFFAEFTHIVGQDLIKYDRKFMDIIELSYRLNFFEVSKSRIGVGIFKPTYQWSIFDDNFPLRPINYAFLMWHQEYKSFDIGFRVGAHIGNSYYGYYAPVLYKLNYAFRIGYSLDPKEKLDKYRSWKSRK